MLVVSPLNSFVCARQPNIGEFSKYAGWPALYGRRPVSGRQLFLRLNEQLRVQFSPSVVERVDHLDFGVLSGACERRSELAAGMSVMWWFMLEPAELELADVIDIAPRIKTMQLVERSSAMCAYLQARACVDAARSLRLMRRAVDHFEQMGTGSLRSNIRIIHAYASCLAELWSHASGVEAVALGARVDTLHQMAIATKADHVQAMYAFAVWKERTGRFEQARLYYLKVRWASARRYRLTARRVWQAILAAPSNAAISTAYVALLVRMQLVAEATAFVDAQTAFRAAAMAR